MIPNQRFLTRISELFDQEGLDKKWWFRLSVIVFFLLSIVFCVSVIVMVSKRG